MRVVFNTCHILSISMVVSQVMMACSLMYTVTSWMMWSKLERACKVVVMA